MVGRESPFLRCQFPLFREIALHGGGSRSATGGLDRAVDRVLDRAVDRVVTGSLGALVQPPSSEQHRESQPVSVEVVTRPRGPRQKHRMPNPSKDFAESSKIQSNVAAAQRFQRCVGYCTAESYDFDRLSKSLQKLNRVPSLFFSEVIHVSLSRNPPDIETEEGDVFYFKDGCVVFWDVPHAQVLQIFEELKGFELGAYDKVTMYELYSEEMPFHYGRTPGLTPSGELILSNGQTNWGKTQASVLVPGVLSRHVPIATSLCSTHTKLHALSPPPCRNHPCHVPIEHAQDPRKAIMTTITRRLSPWSIATVVSTTVDMPMKGTGGDELRAWLGGGARRCSRKSHSATAFSAPSRWRCGPFVWHSLSLSLSLSLACSLARSLALSLSFIQWYSL